jgi:AraC-like DNA-binding protein
MKLYIKYDINIAVRKILREQLDKLGLQYQLIGIGEIEIEGTVPTKIHSQLNAALGKYGIGIVTNQKSALIQKIKDAIVEMVYLEEKLPSSKISSFLAEKLSHSYGYLSNLFSEVTHTSIENFIIMQKIERTKQLIIANELTLTEISYKLNYSSVAHLSNQFKKTTGLTPSAFQRIIRKRQE